MQAMPTKSCTALLIFAALFLHGCAALAASASASDNSLGDLYSSMLQREYTGPVSFPNHQVERKAQRSPSLRLRFGRRSDATFPIFGNRFSKYIEEINKKPIRSPSLRLRFGKRDPMYSDDYYSNELTNELQPRDQNVNRWPEQVDSLGDQAEYEPMPEKRKSVHLRFGRSLTVQHVVDPINPDRPEVLSDDAMAMPRLNSQSPKAGDLVSLTGV